MMKKTEAGNLRMDSSSLGAEERLPRRGKRPGLFHWTLSGAGLVLLAGCATAHHEEAPAPSPAAEAQIAPLHTNDSAVQATPLNEMISDGRKFLATKRGKEVLVGSAGLFFVGIALLVFFKVLRGSSPPRSRNPIRSET